MPADGLPLTPELHDEIEWHLGALRVAQGAGTPSEYAFANLYLFRHAHAYRYVPGQYPRILGTTYDGARHVLPLFDPRHASDEILREVLAGQDCLYPVTTAVLAEMGPSRFAWEDRQDDDDYVYSADNFRHYRGELLGKKKNLMRQLLSAHAMEVRPLSDATLADAGAVQGAWMAAKDKRPGEADDGACREALARHRQFGLDGLVYYADGVAVGFLIAQRLGPGLAVMRFAKGCDTHKGIYQYMFHHYCVGEADLEWLNFEQDLGLSNFRQSKRSYQPTTMLRKLRVRLRA